MAKICHTPQEAYEAGRRLVRDNGWRLSPAALDRCVALTLPYLDRIRAAQEAASDKTA